MLSSSGAGGLEIVQRCVHLVSLRRFPSFRTQPLENITPLSMNKWLPEQPSPWQRYSKRESCYGDRVYFKVEVHKHWRARIDARKSLRSAHEPILRISREFDSLRFLILYSQSTIQISGSLQSVYDSDLREFDSLRFLILNGAVAFMPMPMPKAVRRTCSQKNRVQSVDRYMHTDRYTL